MLAGPDDEAYRRQISNQLSIQRVPSRLAPRILAKQQSLSWCVPGLVLTGPSR